MEIDLKLDLTLEAVNYLSLKIVCVLLMGNRAEMKRREPKSLLSILTEHLGLSIQIR